MRKAMAFLIATAMTVSLLGGMTAASAEQPDGYWPYFEAYSDAMKSGNTNDILNTGDALLSFYSQFAMNGDIASMCYNIYYYRYINEVFEKRGDYDSARTNAEKLVSCASYLGYTDMVIAASERAEKINPMAELYALSDDSSPAVYYGAKYEPRSGTYYGRVADMKNTGDRPDEAIASFYVELGRETAADFSWAIDKYDDGQHILHIALNFPNEGTTAAEIISGTDDANIIETLSYIAALKSPVLLRIGAEMNLWESDPGTFKEAYIHVAEMARKNAPNAALVWSPNFIGSWGSEMSSYYPGDGYVDWVGLSLYTNSAPAAGKTADDDNSMYFGRGIFADCVLSAMDVAKFAENRCKPVIVTEGGTGIVSKLTGVSYEAMAAEQVSKMYTALDMVYPNIKGIIYFDNDTTVDEYKYALNNSAGVGSAYSSAVGANPTLLKARGLTAPSYVKLSGYSGTSGIIHISAYCDTIYSGSMTVSYYLSGSRIAAASSQQYGCAIDAAALGSGSYAFEAVFNDGAGYTQTKTYTLTKMDGGAYCFSDGYDASAQAGGPSSWADGEVDLAFNNSLVPETMRCFYTSDISRLDFCRLVIRLIEKKSGMGIETVLKSKNSGINYNAFTDTTDENVLAANALGIVSGRGDRVFDCSSSITRAEAAKMLMNAALVLRISPSGTVSAFDDSSSFPSWAAAAISFVSASFDSISGRAVMGGVGENLFSPDGTFTRQQAFITMLRLSRA